MAATTVRKSRLTDSDLVGLGKGMFAKIKPNPDARNKPWLGGAGPIVDQAQSEINRGLGYWK